MTETWAVRVQRVMRALGWPKELMARELGLVSPRAVQRLLDGGRPTVEVLLRLQKIETTYAGEIQAYIPGRGRRKKAYLWPPRWVGCLNRRWIGGPEVKPPSRPADLQALGPSRTDAASVLTGWLDPGNFPGRVLRVIDWTPEGRRRYAKDRADAARERDAARPKRPRPVGAFDFARSKRKESQDT